MTLDGLSVAVDLPERDLHSLLVGLMARGRVRRLGEATNIHYRYGGRLPILVTVPPPPSPSGSDPSRTAIPRAQAEPELAPSRARR
jgi:hypothetical protein